MRRTLCWTYPLLGLFIAGSAWAQTAPNALDAKLASLESAAKAAQSAGDNAWMLVSAALVLMMTGPGLALFYGGLVRRKNVLEHDDAQLRSDGRRHGLVGGLRLQFRLR